MWIKRSVKEKIIKASSSRPVVLLTGARQTGKSSLLQRIFKDAEYITFDHIRYVEQAKDSPGFFLDQFKGRTILDEIQYVPEIFRELKIRVDSDRKNYGKWILTGSRQFELMEKTSESLAGRISINKLETLSVKELRNASFQETEAALWLGGYPELWSNAGIDTIDFFESYIRTYLERDLKQIVNVRNLSDFRKLLMILAARTGQLINFREISREIGVADVTVKSWISALQAGGVIYLLPPYHSNIGKRLAKMPKIFFADTGLVCHLLGIETAEEWHNHVNKGNLWENFVMMELIKTKSLIPGQNLYFYRDQNGVEIDFLIEKKNRLMFIEAKASERIDYKKTNFRKVMPLFKDRYSTEAYIAQKIPERKAVRFKDHIAFNPLLCDFPD